MKYFLLAMALMGTLVLNGQTFAELMHSGKYLMKAAKDENRSADYSGAVMMFEQAVKLQPDNAEAHYFLGYAYDRNDCPGFSGVNKRTAASVLRCSKEFETVIRLSPKYGGELLIQDPYAKLTSMWGVLAFSFMVNNKHNSARWAFSEGKKRGGFSDFCLDIGRQALLACDKNAIFFTSGDYITVSLWYVQEMENLRPDVTPICTSTMQVLWVTDYLYEKAPWLFSSARMAYDTTQYFKWNTKTITIPEKNTGKNFLWTVKPAINGMYMSRANILLCDIIKTNKFNRSVYFEKGIDPGAMLGLEDYTKDCFITDQLITEKDKKRSFAFLDLEQKFPIDIVKAANPNSDIEVNNARVLRVEYLEAVNILVHEQKITDAKSIYQKLVAVMPLDKFPYYSVEEEDYVNSIKDQMH